MKKIKNKKICVVGLGYVGLPLAVAFGKKFKTIGFDISTEKVRQYKSLNDPTGEVSRELFSKAVRLEFTSEPKDLTDVDVFIVAVPTPVNDAHLPDFRPLISATAMIAKVLKGGALIIYESTVYPGATEEICVPELERESGLIWKKDFHVGYSPERVNPGDKDRTLEKITKVVSGDDESTLSFISELYASIIDVGVYPVKSIKIAEAAKVIENTQRDLNIALMNELAILFNKMGLDTLEVLEAAGTKWNFLPFRPGLVGGHCIGVDPYYLTHKAEMLGYHPQVILAGRRINDSMATFIVQQIIKLLIKKGTSVKGAKIIVLGLTFKENCADLRNSKVVDMVNELNEFGCELYVHDPIANHEESINEYGIRLNNWDQLPHNSDAIVAAVSHNEFISQPTLNLLAPLKSGGLFVDIKSAYCSETIRAAGVCLWRL
jgi:UDP-N-acetyl-D-galactosamine dehydrogenase